MYKDGDKLSFEVVEANHNHLVVKNEKSDNEGFLYANEMPKVTVECVIVDEDEENVILLTEEIDGEDKNVLPGGTMLPDEASGQTACRIIEEYTGLKMDSGDLELYDFRTNPGRDSRQWLVSVIYIARAGKPDDSGAWAKIKDVLLEEDGFGYDHHRVLQNFEYNC